MKRLVLFFVFVSLMTGCSSCNRSTSNSNSEANTNVAWESPFANITDANQALAEGNRLLDENQTEQAIEALRQANVAGVQHHRFVTDAKFTPVGRHALAGNDCFGVDKVWNDPNLVGVGGPYLGDNVAPKVVGQHRDGARSVVTRPFEE